MELDLRKLMDFESAHPDIEEGQKLGTRALSHTVGFASSTDDLAALGGPSQIEHWVEVPSLRVDNQEH